MKCRSASRFDVWVPLAVALFTVAGCWGGGKPVGLPAAPRSENQPAAAPALRTDGLYVAEVGSRRQFLRFTEQEVWIADSDQEPAAAAKWIGTEQPRKPQRGQHQLEGANLRVDSPYVSFDGVLQVDGLQATIEPPEADKGQASESRTYAFQPFESLPPVTDQARHLAACYEQFLKLQQFTSQPAGPMQPERFLQATADLANWIEMTPADRQRIVEEPAVHQTPIGELRRRSQMYLTPAGGMPPPMLMQNLAGWKPHVLKIIETQLRNERQARFFIAWLLQSVPPPMIPGELRGIVQMAPDSEFTATELEEALRPFPPLQALPGGLQLIDEWATRGSPALQQLAAGLRSGSGRSPASPAKRSASNRPNYGVRLPPLQQLGPWQVVADSGQPRQQTLQRAQMERGVRVYILESTEKDETACFQLAPELRGDFRLSFMLASEPTSPPQRRTVRVRVWPIGEGQTPFYTVLNASGKAEHASVELINTGGKLSCQKDGAEFGSTSQVGQRVQVQLLVQGLARVRVSNVQVQPITAVVDADQPAALRDLETLKADAQAQLEPAALLERFGAGVVGVHSGKLTQDFGGVMVGTKGLVLTCLEAAQSGIVEVTCRSGDEDVRQLAAIVGVDTTTGLVLLAVDPPSVLPVVSLAKRPAAERQRWLLAPPGHDEHADAVSPLSVSTGGQLAWPAERPATARPGLPIFDSQGQLVGLLAASSDHSEVESIAADDILAGLVRMASTEGPDGALLRCWTDNSGSYRRVAQLVQIEPDHVTLAREGSQRIDVPLERLSDQDRRLIELIQARQEQ